MTQNLDSIQSLTARRNTESTASLRSSITSVKIKKPLMNVQQKEQSDFLDKNNLACVMVRGQPKVVKK